MSVIGNPITLGGGGGNPRFYLIKDGLEIGSSLVSVGKKTTSSSSVTAGAPPVSHNTGNIFCGWTSSSSTLAAGIVYLPDMVDLSRYTKLAIDGEFKFAVGTSQSFGGTANCIDAWTEIGNAQDNNRVFQISFFGAGSTTLNSSLDLIATEIFDISSYTSTVYVGFNLTRTAAGYVNITIKNMWLE